MGVDNMPRGVHVVGSVPLRTSEEVFRTLATELGDRLRRIPDGETGERALFAGWQAATFARHPDFQPAPSRRLMEVVKPYQVRTGADRSGIRFTELGFAAAAVESYGVFRRLRSEGVIRPGLRFLVSLPTPVNCLAMVLVKDDVREIEPAFEEAMLAEVDAIVSTVPAEDLAIQWDTPWEVRAWDGSLPAFLVQPWFPDVPAGIMGRLLRLGARVPEAAELGYHLCHGDYEHTGNLILGLGRRPRSRFVRSVASKLLREVSVRVAGPPKDMRTVTEMADALLERSPRRIDFLHLPVPRDAGDAYFAPLASLRPPPGLETYLGLVHFTDSLAGTRRRIAAAGKVVTADFGVSTECGWGRRDPDTIPGLIELHRSVSSTV
jgi:hypothetical protein